MHADLSSFRRVAFVALLLALLPAFALAQRAPTVKARIDPVTIKLGGQGVLVVEIENAQVGEIAALPAVDGLRFGAIGPAAQSRFMSNVNGRVTNVVSLTWRIAVQPLKAGEFVIPPFVVRADGQDVSTRELRVIAAEDFRGDELGLLEIDAPKEVWQGEPFTLEIRVGFDVSIEGRLNYHDLVLPWLGEFGGLLEREDVTIPSGRSAGTILLNSREKLEVESLGTRKVGNANFFVLRARKRFVATRPGTLTFPESHFEFGRRTDSFQRLMGGNTGDFSNFKRAPAFAIEVKAIPEDGRPLDWSGAVGKFEVAAVADRRDVDAGDSIKLTVEWTGEGNLEFFDAPDLKRVDGFEPFRIYATDDNRKTPVRRSVTYDVVPIEASTKEIPPVPLRVFDTSTGRYEVVATKPIPIQVRPRAGATGLSSPTTAATTSADLRDIQTDPASGGVPSAPGGGALALVATGTFAGWIALRTAVRRRGDPDAPRARARRRAKRELERALRSARTPEEQMSAVHAFLAARSGETPEAWAGRDPVRWSREHGGARLEPAAARDLGLLLARLDAAIWGGAGASKVEERDVLALADRVAAGGL